jgi:dihydroorotase
MELVVEGECFVSGRLERLCVGIDDGKIMAVGKSLEGDKHLDFGRLKVIPGATDCHVHFRDPGMTSKEDFHTGSLAALHGGVTCVMDMPNTNPPTLTVDSIREKKAIARQRCLADFGLFAGVRPGTDIDELSGEAAGFKLYMAGTTGDLLVPSLDSVSQELDRIRSCGKVLAVHA